MGHWARAPAQPQKATSALVRPMSRALFGAGPGPSPIAHDVGPMSCAGLRMSCGAVLCPMALSYVLWICPVAMSYVLGPGPMSYGLVLCPLFCPLSVRQDMLVTPFDCTRARVSTQ